MPSAKPNPDFIALTGGAGHMAELLIPRLIRPNRILRLIDIADIAETPVEDRIEAHCASITDIDALAQIFAGVRAVVHLAGQSYESDMDDIVETNVRGTYCMLEAARLAGVTTVVLASSNHATGFYPVQSTPGPLPADVPGRPDTLYGWSKAAVESLGRLYADRFGIDMTCIRIGSCQPEPSDERSLALWLSPDDAARIVEASIGVHPSGYRIIWGISRNARRFMSLAEGEQIGYFPEDDAELYAGRIIGADACAQPPRRVGGPWCWTPLGISNRH